MVGIMGGQGRRHGGSVERMSVVLLGQVHFTGVVVAATGST